MQWFEEKQIAYKTLSLGTFASNSELGHAYAKGKGANCDYCIVINKKIGMDGFVARCIMWHEFCHCWDWATRDKMNHDGKWFRKWLSKPLYVIGIIISVIYIIFKLIIDKARNSIISAYKFSTIYN